MANAIRERLNANMMPMKSGRVGWCMTEAGSHLAVNPDLLSNSLSCRMEKPTRLLRPNEDVCDEITARAKYAATYKKIVNSLKNMYKRCSVAIHC